MWPEWPYVNLNPKLKFSLTLKVGCHEQKMPSKNSQRRDFFNGEFAQVLPLSWRIRSSFATALVQIDIC
jgi:hypothetical protein